MHKIIEYIDREMKEYEDKISRGAELSSKDVECLKDLAKTKMAILTNRAMEDEDGGYSERYSRDDGMDGRTSHGRMYYGGGSYPRYYSYAKRDGRGKSLQEKLRMTRPSKKLNISQTKWRASKGECRP